MHSSRSGGFQAFAIALTLTGSAFGAEPGVHLSANPYCTGEYADEFTALAAYVREFERQPQSRSSSYCVRNTAIYECLSYSADGSLRRVRRKAVLHGTAFGYRVVGGETLLLTNQHVAEWPAVTDDEHQVEDVPAGCKRVSDSIKIVDNEADAYERDDIPLARVVADAQLDVAVLKAHVPLQVLPWKVGWSASLREHNVVDVRGYPLGAFQAANVGKVVSAYDHDEEKDWDHDDFVVDALLSPGNSGSPVLAVSCKTGEFELVGIYHANYTGGSALNVVIGIDQVRDLMTTLHRAPKLKADAAQPPSSRERGSLLQDVRSGFEPFFPLGTLPASVRARSDGALVFEVLPRDFPLRSHPIFVVEDLLPQKPDTFGELGRLWFGGLHGLKSYRRSDLEADVQAQVVKLLDALRRNAVATFSYRMAVHGALTSRERFEHMSHLERALRRVTSSQKDLVQLTVDLSERLGPHGSEVPIFLSDAMAVPIPNPAFPPAPVPEVGVRTAADSAKSSASTRLSTEGGGP